MKFVQQAVNLHNCVDSTAVSVPHRPKPRLAAYIPNLQTDHAVVTDPSSITQSQYQFSGFKSNEIRVCI